MFRSEVAQQDSQHVDGRRDQSRCAASGHPPRYAVAVAAVPGLSAGRRPVHQRRLDRLHHGDAAVRRCRRAHRRYPRAVLPGRHARRRAAAGARHGAARVSRGGSASGFCRATKPAASTRPSVATVPTISPAASGNRCRRTRPSTCAITASSFHAACRLAAPPMPR